MGSIQSIAPRNDVREFVVKIDNGAGPKIEEPVRYFRNRITMAPVDLKLPEDAEIDLDELTDAEYEALKAASMLCHYLDEWEITGPLQDGLGREIVGSGEVIPLDPRIVQHVPSVIVSEVLRQLTEHVFPNARRSRSERRRSR